MPAQPSAGRSHVLNWLVRYDDDEAVFRRPVAQRLWSSLLLAVCTCVYLAVVFHALTARPHEQGVLIQWTLSFVFLVVVFGLGTGPNDMSFDFRRKRYQARTGYLFFSRTRTGGFDEISHVAVWNHSRFSGLTLVWNDRKRRETAFFPCGDKTQAQSIGGQLGRSIGVPVKEAGVFGTED